MCKVFIEVKRIKELSGLELGVLASLNKLCNDKTFMFNNVMIQHTLYNKVSEDQKIIGKFDSAIKSLIDKEIVKVVEFFGKGRNTTYLCTNENIFIDGKSDKYTKDDKYCYVEYETLVKTAQANDNMIKYLFAIASSFNNETRVGFKTIETYCEEFNLVDKTFRNYETVFVDKEILYIVHSKPFKDYNGCVKTPANNYAEWSNQETAIKMAEDYRKSIGANSNSDTFEGARSIKGTYNHFVDCKNKNDIEKYDTERLSLIYADCVRYNEHFTKQANKGDKYAQERLIDLSVFDGLEIKEVTPKKVDKAKKETSKKVNKFKKKQQRRLDELKEFIGEKLNGQYGAEYKAILEKEDLIYGEWDLQEETDIEFLEDVEETFKEHKARIEYNSQKVRPQF